MAAGGRCADARESWLVLRAACAIENTITTTTGRNMTSFLIQNSVRHGQTRYCTGRTGHNTAAPGVNSLSLMSFRCPLGLRNLHFLQILSGAPFKVEAFSVRSCALPKSRAKPRDLVPFGRGLKPFGMTCACPQPAD